MMDIPITLQDQARRESADGRARAHALFASPVVAGPMTTRPRSGRLRIYAFTPAALISLGQHEGRLVTANPTIPADARACGVAYDFMRDLFLVRVESAEFAEVPEGMMVPMGDGPWVRVEPEGQAG
jgi:hypothetical protein